MPTKVYTGIDFINYIEGFVINTGPDMVIASPSSQFNGLITLNAGYNYPGVPGSVQIAAASNYQMSGDLDFDAFPAIPAGSVITRIEVKMEGSALATADAAASGGSASHATIATALAAVAITPFGGDTLFDLLLSVYLNDPGNGAASIAGNVSDAYTATQVFDFSGAPITREELVTMFTSWIVSLSISAQVNANTSA